MNHALLCLVGLAVGMIEVQGEEPAGTKASGRVIEGRIIAAGSEPVEGAKILFGQHERGKGSVDEATATRRKGTTIKQYKVIGFPSLFVIDRDGTMIGKANPEDDDRLERLVRDLLEKDEQIH